MRTILLFFVALFAVGCANQSDRYSRETPSIVILPYFAESHIGKASQSSFAVGDKIGLCAILTGQELRKGGNLINNACFESLADGSVRAQPTDLYYPDKASSLDLMAYYPYQSDILDLTSFKHSVKTDQSTAEDLTKSDFCFARQTTFPTSEARQMRFAHLLSKVSLDVALPSRIGAREVVDIEHIAVIDATLDVVVDLSADAPLTLGSAMGSIRTSGREIILPAQTFNKNVPLFSITVRYSNSETESFVYAPSQDMVLAESTTSHVSLTLSDKGAVDLSGSVLTEPWTESLADGGVEQSVKNSFTAQWRLPHKDYASINKVVLTIKDPLSGVVSDLPTTFTRIEAGATSEMCTILFSFAPSSSVGLTYPYLIEGVKFYAAATLVQDCKTVIAAKVYRSGPYTIGIEQDNLLAIATGTIKSWTELTLGGGVVGGGVTSSFRLRLIEPSYPIAQISQVRIKIGTTTYVFEGLTFEPTSNVLLSTSKEFAFPDKNGLSPKGYPYTISRVDLYDAKGLLLNGAAASVEVTRSGLVSLQFYRNEIVWLANTVSLWGEATSGGDTDYSGPLASNPLTLYYMDGQATLFRPCTSAAKMVVTIDGAEVTYPLVMTGNGSSAKSASFEVSTGIPVESLPTNYPYSIGRVKIYDSSSNLLIDEDLATPIKVRRAGALILRVIR